MLRMQVWMWSCVLETSSRQSREHDTGLCSGPTEPRDARSGGESPRSVNVSDSRETAPQLKLNILPNALPRP